MSAEISQGASDAELKAIDRSSYLEPLEELKRVAEEIPNSPLMVKQKVNALTLLNMQWENCIKDRELSQHPFDLCKVFIEDAISNLQQWKNVGFIENQENLSLDSQKASQKDDKHHDLFQDLWVNFSEDEYNERIERYVYRLKINDLFDGFFKDKVCIDLGCGHGNFAHALIKAGAASVTGFDFGENSIAYASKAKERLRQDKVNFVLASVYELPLEDNAADFAIQNGVFHHLENEDQAIAEASRVIKKGGHIWYYTDGAYGVSYQLWDASVYILRNVPHDMVTEHLDYLNLSTGKRYHLGDGLNATYRHDTWEGITSRLAKHGFGNFKRIVGGYDTDFDHDVISEDKYGVEKFGSGDLRIIAEKVE